MSELWARALADIKDEIGRQNVETWIAPIHFVSRNKNEIVLEVPNKFFRDWVIENYARKLEIILSTAAKHRDEADQRY
jgi:chromosomal replication initiator protein